MSSFTKMSIEMSSGSSVYLRTPAAAILTAIAMLASPCAAAPAAELRIDFAKRLQAWDGFGANYVETRHTRDYAVFPQDYGGFKCLDDAQRERIVDLVFGDDGLRVSLLKIFADPFHERQNDNDDPCLADPSKFDHETTTRWIRYFARRGLEKTRARGDELMVLVGLYGPPGWVTRQQILQGRDLEPGYEAEIAEYLAVFSKYLRDVEGVGVKYISMHNEGESRGRWPDDGSDPVNRYHFDYNMWWPDRQIVEFLRVARRVLNAHGLPEIELTSGETATWANFNRMRTNHGLGMQNARAIREDPEALAHLGLITSHGFRPRTKPGNQAPRWHDPSGVRLLREAKPELHAWTTSYTWGEMDVEIVQDAQQLIYQVGCNGLIPWAMVHHDHESDKLSPPATFRVSGNANSPIMTNGGAVLVTKAYYYYKQLTRAGRPGMAVAEAVSDNEPTISCIAFAANGTKAGNAFIVINAGEEPREIALLINNAGADKFEVRVTSDAKFGDMSYAPAGIARVEERRMAYTAPARSATTFFSVSTIEGMRRP